MVNTGRFSAKNAAFDSINIDDTSTDPTSNGVFTNNAGNIKVQSGGVVKNLSDIGTGGGSNDPVIYVPGDYAAIQDAVNAVDTDGGIIMVDIPNYDPTVETLPILVNEPVTFIGTTVGDQLSDGMDFSAGAPAEDLTNPVFDVDISPQWRVHPTFIRMKVLGGQDIVNFTSGARAVFEDCWFRNADRHGIYLSNTSEALYLNVNNCIIDQCGQGGTGDGINMLDATTSNRPNAFAITNTISRSHPNGSGMQLKGVGGTVLAGSTEDNGGAGIVIGDQSSGTTVSLHGCYFEHNGQNPPGGEGSKYDSDVVVDLADSGGSPSQSDKSVAMYGLHQSPAGTQADHGIYIKEGQGCSVVGLKGTSTSRKIEVGSNARDTFLYGMHNDIDITDNGIRTRINGLATDSGAAEEPTAGDWEIGDTVEWTDTGDASGNGLYVLRHDGTTWNQIGTF